MTDMSTHQESSYVRWKMIQHRSQVQFEKVLSHSSLHESKVHFVSCQEKYPRTKDFDTDDIHGVSSLRCQNMIEESQCLWPDRYSQSGEPWRTLTLTRLSRGYEETDDKEYHVEDNVQRLFRCVLDIERNKTQDSYAYASKMLQEENPTPYEARLRSLSRTKRRRR